MFEDWKKTDQRGCDGNWGWRNVRGWITWDPVATVRSSGISVRVWKPGRDEVTLAPLWRVDSRETRNREEQWRWCFQADVIVSEREWHSVVERTGYFGSEAALSD